MQRIRSMTSNGDRWRQRVIAGAMFVVVWSSFDSPLFAQADYMRFYDEGRLPIMKEALSNGRYHLIIDECEEAKIKKRPSWEWRTLHIEALTQIGRYEDALAEAREAIEQVPGSLGILLAARELYETMGLAEEADAAIDAINEAASVLDGKAESATDLVLLGRAAMVLGADPSLVWKRYFNPAKEKKEAGTKVAPGVLEAHLAAGELALMKGDYKRAGEEYKAAFKLKPRNIGVLLGYAECSLPLSRKIAENYVDKALEIGPRQVDAMLLKVELSIIFERYSEADFYLEAVKEINPRHPKAFAYQAILAELRGGNRLAFGKARKQALSVWKDNPEIDYLIGRVLSDKYRYQEGAESQRRALEIDPDFVPAKIQLALDHLRIGEVEAAWPLAEAVAEADEYNVLAYNLAILKQELERFATIENDDFIIRMDPDEAVIYGDRALELLTEAKEVLGKKYGLKMEGKTLVEFYPSQQDFAIRTFGSLGGVGLLGVCFGSVVTMNSPGSIGAFQSNWEATLWHEYCHVVTLTATKNRMPRWLSEGISVYEEKQRQSNWGQDMNPTYRDLILNEGELMPIAEMSSAFFDGESINFAYFQSMLAVEFLIEKYGHKGLRAILSDLAEGKLINEAIARVSRSMLRIEKQFAAWAEQKAAAYGAQVDWHEPTEYDVDVRSEESILKYLEQHPAGFRGRLMLTQFYHDRENWKGVLESSERFIELLPEYVGAENGYAMKALAQRKLGDHEGETKTLAQLAELSADAHQAYHRLLEVGFSAENWPEVLANVDRAKAINPLSSRLHYCGACAYDGLAQPASAVKSFEKALRLNPVNSTEIQYRLAKLLKDEDRERAKRYVMDALVESPRYQDALVLLLELADKPEEEQAAAEVTPEAPAPSPQPTP